MFFGLGLLIWSVLAMLSFTFPTPFGKDGFKPSTYIVYYSHVSKCFATENSPSKNYTPLNGNDLTSPSISRAAAGNLMRLGRKAKSEGEVSPKSLLAE